MYWSRRCLVNSGLRRHVLPGSRIAIRFLHRLPVATGTLRLATRRRFHGWSRVYDAPRRTCQRGHRLLQVRPTDESLGGHSWNANISSTLDGGSSLDVLSVRTLILGDSRKIINSRRNAGSLHPKINNMGVLCSRLVAGCGFNCTAHPVLKRAR
mgnify:CR=1 FL=1